ncbi:nicotinate-nucleotide adenylyltransferase [Spirochaetia bacterium]|nr:nicotinate-nucleotide adenylyltransferase [Spirochaetia bacterium]
MKLAVLGGSFNPIHNGHLYVADSALALGFDRVILVPANISPFKQHLAGTVSKADSASAGDRLDMILASITVDPRFSADDLEIRREGVSYTIDTLKEIIKRYRPQGKPGLILGDDLVSDFPQWRNAEEITRMADIIVARRLGGKAAGSGMDAAGSGMDAAGFPFPHRPLDNEVMDVSSAMVRERIAHGRAWRYLVPRGARLIIEDRGLYAAEAAHFSLPLIARVEDAVREALSPKRFLHSRNTALMARDMALRYGLDADAAYLAGIAHDMAKPEKKDLSHGRAAAVLLEKHFGIHNGDILEAVAVHTTGKAGMGNLAKLVFIADKIEYTRPDVQNRFREMAVPALSAGGPDSGQDKTKLDDIFYAVLEDNVRWLREQGKTVAEETITLLDTMKVEVNRGKGL